MNMGGQIGGALTGSLTPWIALLDGLVPCGSRFVPDGRPKLAWCGST